MTLFEKYFSQILQEDNITGGGGVWGGGDSIGQPTPFSSDFYAPGDARNIFGAGQASKKKSKKRKSKKRKGNRKKKMGEGPLIPVQRRKMSNGGL